MLTYSLVQLLVPSERKTSIWDYGGLELSLTDIEFFIYLKGGLVSVSVGI